MMGMNKRTTTTTNISNNATSRRESSSSQHSLIEKRRRERINDKIQQLKEIIPTCNPYSDQQPIRGPSFHQPLHKLAILEAAIDYIQQMHQTLLNHSSGDDSHSMILTDPNVLKVIEHAHQCKQEEAKSRLM
ncbi:helix-loop-helix DNA-binding domain-containing protein [Circinella umbellata]|nr:helix-loop-helix DNA-binding domain-containing protein [Circinella umbellata]